MIRWSALIVKTSSSDDVYCVHLKYFQRPNAVATGQQFCLMMFSKKLHIANDKSCLEYPNEVCSVPLLRHTAGVACQAPFHVLQRCILLCSLTVVLRCCVNLLEQQCTHCAVVCVLTTIAHAHWAHSTTMTELEEQHQDKEKGMNCIPGSIDKLDIISMHTSHHQVHKTFHVC